jgi:PKD repeat protein
MTKIFLSGAVVSVALISGLPLAHADCTLTNTDRTPLNDLGPGLYEGFSGGLYPNGANTRPPAHEAAGLNIATNQVMPLDANGNVNTNTGKIVMISIGMSITTYEFGSYGSFSFEARANADPAKNPRLMIVDCAQSAMDAPNWTNVNAATWATNDVLLAAAGVTSNQVQVAWMKQLLSTAASDGPFPIHAQHLQTQLEQIARNARIHYPNIHLLYISCRSRAYTTDTNTTFSPEPYAYESGWSTKWAVQDQINGTNNLNYDSNDGPVVAPWLSWGPYLWADGTTPRSDGLEWLCSDVQSDFQHPSTGGVFKVAGELLSFFKTDPTAMPWFLKPTLTPPTLSVSATPSNGVAPLVVNFSATASNGLGAVTNIVWTFDDGDFAYETRSPVKTFPDPGTYQVHVTAEDAAGNAATTTTVITVSAPAFAITSISIDSSNNVHIGWPTVGGSNYVVQATAGSGGSFSTNNFADISTSIPAPPFATSHTNYVDVAGATNSPARYYRLRLGP